MDYGNKDKNEMIIDMLRHCGHALRALPHNGGAKARVLDLLDGGSCPQKVLTEALGIQPGSASELLGKMESEGLILREPLPTDRRGMRVSLTEKGQEQLQRQGTTPAAQWLSCFTDEEKTQLLELLGKLLGYWHESLLPQHPHRPPYGPRPFGGRPVPPPYGGRGFEGRPFPPHGDRGFDGFPGGRAPHGRPDLGRRRREGRLPDGEIKLLDSRTPDAPYDGEEVCIHNCRECPLGPQGRCVRRV